MDKKTTKPHDSYFLTSMSKPEVARDFIKAYLPPDIYKKLDLNYLEQCKQSYIEDALKKKIVDVLYKTRFKTMNNDRDAYVYILTESQSTPEKWMPFRLMKYIFLIMDDHVRQYKVSTLPLVIPIVVYNGKAPYNYSTDIFTLFGEQELLARTILLNPFHLIDLHTIDDKILREHAGSALMEWCMKHTYNRNILQYVDILKELIEAAKLENDMQYFVQTLTYIIYTMDTKQAQKFIQDLANKLPNPFVENTMTIADRLKKEAFQQGMQQGIQKGIQQGIQKGEHKLLLHQLQQKFHQLPDNYREKLENASTQDLLTWGERALDASSLDEIFQE